MKNANPIFSLKNFRSFGVEGADFELAPITVLTGCNSAGKSSLVKAILLLSIDNGIGRDGASRQKSISETKNSIFSDMYYPSHILKVTSRELGLGRFDKVLHRNAKEGLLTLSYKMWSKYLGEELDVTRLFRANSNDILNNGELIEFTIKRLNGTILYDCFPKDPVFKYPRAKKGSLYIEDSGWYYEWNYDLISEPYKKYCDIRRYYDWQDFKQLSQYDFGQRNNDGSIQRILKMIKDNPQLLEDYGKRMDELKKQYGEEVYDYRDKFQDRSPNNDSEYELKLYALMFRMEDYLKNYKSDYDICQEIIQKIYVEVVNECISPRFIASNTYIDSSSAVVKRLYSIEDENKLSVALDKVVKRGVIRDTLVKSGIIETGDFVNDWLTRFDIADKIIIKGTEEGIGIKVFIVKGKEKRLLADEGYGITQLASLFIQIENIISENTRDCYKKNPTDNVIYVEDGSHYQPSYIIIEEPENHLHPKYQSLLADMFVEAYRNYNIHFIIETHSEYLIRKLQYLVSEKVNGLVSSDVSLNYVEKDENGISTNRQIKIREDGSLSEPFGSGFFDESKKWVMKMMKFEY